MITDKSVMWDVPHSIADWDGFRSSRLTIDLGGILRTFGSRTFGSMSWTCKKQTSVSHKPTDSEVLSLDASLRMDGIPVSVN